MGQFALPWILMFEGVTCAIPGAKRSDQVKDNCGASDLPPFSAEAMAGVRRIYESGLHSRRTSLMNFQHRNIPFPWQDPAIDKQAGILP